VRRYFSLASFPQQIVSILAWRHCLRFFSQSLGFFGKPFWKG